MSEPTPYQTIDERLASVETKADRLIVGVDAGRAETQAAFKELRSLVAANDVAIRADMKEVEHRLRSEIQETQTSLRSEINQTQTSLRSEINQTQTSLRSEINETEINEAENKLRTEINATEARLIDHTNRNTDTVLNHVRLIALGMVPIFLGVLGILAKMIYSSG